MSFLCILDESLFEKGIEVTHADTDVDVNIIKMVIEKLNALFTILFCDDINLLVLLLFHANSNEMLCLTNAKQSGSNVVWNIDVMKTRMEIELYDSIILFYALLGSDTTFIFQDV